MSRESYGKQQEGVDKTDYLKKNIYQVLLNSKHLLLLLQLFKMLLITINNCLTLKL